MAEKEPTTKFRVDISELKKGMQEAQRQIRLANSEFKAATAGMDKWSDSADGVSAKIKQLESVLEAEKKKLQILEEQYALVAKEQGEASKGAQELMIRINNQRAAVGRTESSVAKFTKILSELESQQNDVEQAMSGMSKKAGEVDSVVSDVGDAVKDSAKNFDVMKIAIGNLIADGLKALAKEAKDAMTTLIKESEAAYNSFQAQTGANTKEMQAFSKEIKALYKDNFGDSLQDVADVMAEVKQQIQETDPKKLKELSENAITLRDTFGMDIKEQMRTVNMMMKQFGINASDAFNLISQGAQNGLNKNDDLLDTINEYSVHYKQMGYDANDFFNSLANGTEAGTFSVDKLADAMKEFGIRTKDTSSTTQEGFEILGYSAGTSKEKVAETKEEIARLEKNLKYAKMEQEGFNKKTSDLTRMKNADKIKEYSKNLADAKKKLKDMTTTGKKSEKSIKNLQDQFAKGGKSAQKATKEVMKKLLAMDDKVKQNQAGVDLFGTMWEDLGIEGVKALMNTNGELDKSKQSMEEIKKIKYDDTMNQLSTLGREIEMDVIAPLVEKALPYARDFFSYIEKHLDETIKIVGTVGGVVATAFVANKVANFVTSVQTLVTTFTTLKKVTMEAEGAQKLLNAAQALSPAGVVAAAVGGLITALIVYNQKMDAAREKAAELTDAQQENRDAINELNDAYKDARKTRDESVSNTTAEFQYYEALKDELDDLVDKNGKVKKGQKERADFIMGTLNKAFGTELKRTGDIIKNYEDQSKALKELMKTQKAKLILDANENLYAQAISKRTESFTNYEKAKKDVADTEKQVDEAEKRVKKLQEQFNNTKYVTSSIRVGIDLEKAEKELEGAKEKLEGMNKAVIDAEKTWTNYNATIRNYEGLSSAIISGDSKKIKKALENMTNNFITAKEGSKRVLQEQYDNLRKNYEDLKRAVKNGAPGVTKEMVSSAKKMVNKASRELEQLEGNAENSGKKAGKAAAKGLDAADTKKVGSKKAKEYSKGIESEKKNVKKSAQKVADDAKKGLKDAKTSDSGEQFMTGFIKGMEKKTKDVGTVVANFAKKSVKALNKELDIHSPSRKTEKSGTYFGQGFVNGINKQTDKVLAAIGKLAKGSLKKLLSAKNDGEIEKAGEKVVSLYEKGLNKKVSKVEKAVEQMVNRAMKQAKKETKNEKTKKAFDALGTSMIESFSSAFEKAAENATTKVENKINALASKYQEKFEDLTSKKTSLKEIYQSSDLFTEDDEGNISLTDFAAETKDIKKIGSNLAKLKKKVSKELLAAIVELSTEDQLKITNKLLSLTGSELQAYNKAYTAKLKASQKVSSDFYSDQLKKLKEQYTDKVEKQIKKLEKSLKKVGENAAKGFISGLKSKDEDMTKAVKELSKSLVKKMKKELGIHSPSTVMRDMVGRYIPEGIAEGIRKNATAAVQAMDALADNIVTPMKNAAGNMTIRKPELSTQSTSRSVMNTYKFYQTNNSPKALSRWDIYRQSKNLLQGVQYV